MRASSRFRLIAALLAAGVGGTARNTEAQAVWSGGINDLYSNPANWVGGVLPANDGSATINLPQTVSFQVIEPDINVNVAGVFFSGSSGYAPYEFYPTGSGTVTIGSGGVSSAPTVYTEFYDYA